MAKSKDRVSVDGLLASVERGRFAPVYFFYGEEDFLIDEMIRVIVTHGLDDSTRQFNLDVVHGSEIGGKEIISLASSFPMMGARRIVLVKDFDHVSDKELIETYLAHPSPTTSLILVASKPDLRKKPYPMLKKNSEGGECARLYDSEIPAWIQQRIQHLRRSISPEAIEVLHAYVGTSLRELANEIDKLLIAVGEERAIEAKDVAAVVGISREFSVFELTKAVGEKDIRRSVEIAEHMMDAGESLQFIIVMLTRHFITLQKLAALRTAKKSEYEMAGEVRVNPYFMREYLSHLGRYTSSAIDTAILELTRADEALKSTGTDVKVLLDVLLCGVMQVSPTSVQTSRGQERRFSF